MAEDERTWMYLQRVLERPARLLWHRYPRLLIKNIDSYSLPALLTCPHPASKDSAVFWAQGHLANYPYDLPEDVTPETGA